MKPKKTTNKTRVATQPHVDPKLQHFAAGSLAGLGLNLQARLLTKLMHHAPNTSSAAMLFLILPFG